MPDPIDLIASRLGDPITVNWPEHTFLCPFCIDRMGSEDRKGHLYVNEEKGFFCHRCEARGRIKWLFHVLGITQEEKKGSVPQLDAQRIREIEIASQGDKLKNQPAGIEPVFLPDRADYVHAHPEVWHYAVVRRGIREFEIERYGILSWVDDRGNPRLLFPDYQEGALVYWTARAVHDHVSPKYEAAKNSEKSMCVWNLDNVAPDRPIYVAEGIMSARACGRNGTAIYGKYLSDFQRHLISTRAGPYGVRIVFDSEAATSSLYATEKFIRAGTPCGIVKIPGVKVDPDELPGMELQPLLIGSNPMSDFDLQRFRLEHL